MNAIDAIGGTKRQRILAEEVARFCVEKMMPRMRTLDVIIELKMKLEDQVKGYCLSIDKRNFYIEIDKSVDTFEEFVKTVCHEMVHVKQGARNELVSSTTKTPERRIELQGIITTATTKQKMYRQQLPRAEATLGNLKKRLPNV